VISKTASSKGRSRWRKQRRSAPQSLLNEFWTDLLSSSYSLATISKRNKQAMEAAASRYQKRQKRAQKVMRPSIKHHSESNPTVIIENNLTLHN